MGSSWHRLSLRFYLYRAVTPSSCTHLPFTSYSVAVMNLSPSGDPTFTSNQSTVSPLANNLCPSPLPDSRNRTPLTLTLSDSNTSELETLHRCELMEKGLNEIRTALGALKTTCATLEMHADRLGSEIAALKGVANTSLLAPTDRQPNRNQTNSEVRIVVLSHY